MSNIEPPPSAGLKKAVARLCGVNKAEIAVMQKETATALRDKYIMAQVDGQVDLKVGWELDPLALMYPRRHFQTSTFVARVINIARSRLSQHHGLVRDRNMYIVHTGCQHKREFE